MPYVGSQPTVGNFVKLDAIVTSATATYNLLNGGVAYTPASVLNMIVSLNGVIQEPTTASNIGGFTISGSTIVFTSALTSLDVIDFILVLGDVLNIGTPSDSTVTFPKVTSNLITGATSETTIAGGDSVLIYDDSASALRKMTRTNFIGGGNTPSFKAYLNGTQTVASETLTKLQIDTEAWDTNSNYDSTTNYRFTPTTAGKYFIYGSYRFDTGATNKSRYAEISIYKNGTKHADGVQIGNYATYTFRNMLLTVTALINFNGTTDYVELFAIRDTLQSTNIDGGESQTYFGGFKLIE